MKIETSYESSWRLFVAVDRHTYTGDEYDPMGLGNTAEEAIRNLVDELLYREGA